ncbi:40-residue YVTN family beta-propeller repeat protein [Thozetella sp. PMI_491]|nr:40-residue YVTN family beta-propeller repeat protein [Thozetella sp. PMI_491]
MKFIIVSASIAWLVGLVGGVRGVVQAPALAGAGAPVSESDRIYTGDQSSNTITVIKPLTGEVLGTISLGDERLTDVIGPQYVRSVNSHGLGFSRDGQYIVSLSVTSNTVTVIRCVDNAIISQTYADRNAHEAFFAADNQTVWVGTRGVDHIDIIDGIHGGVIGKVDSWGGPSKVLFSPDGKTAYANHIRSASLSFIDVASRSVIYNLTGLANSFSSDMMLSADGLRLWVAHKMVGKVSVISTVSRKIVAVLDTGVETNHPNFAVVNGTTYGFVTVAALNLTKVYAQPDPEKAPVYVTSILASGIEPHGLWPSPDNTRMYIVNEHSDTVDFVDLSTMRVVDTVYVGQEGQALIYVADAVPSGSGTQNLGVQGLMGKAAFNKLLSVEGNHSADATALITIRPEQGLDMFQVIGRNLKLNATYTASASCLGCNGVKIPLVDFSASQATTAGCGNAPQVLAFFKFNGVYDAETLEISEK